MRRIGFSVFLFAAVCAGCAAVPYRYEKLETPPIWRDQPQVEIGRANRFLDLLGNIVSVPTKIILLSTRVENHKVSPETVTALENYLRENDLENVKIRVNQYAPGGEWIRLFRNKSVHMGWRVTLGVLTNVYYTILPGRVFGGDHYNPYTNTVNLYSDHPAIALHEAGHAKDFARRTHKGTYAFLRLLPLVPLYQEAQATGDAVGYLRDRQLAEEEGNAYKILYPAYGTYVGGEILNWVPVAPEVSYLLAFGAALPGHVAGRIKAAVMEDIQEPVAAPAPEAPAEKVPEPAAESTVEPPGDESTPAETATISGEAVR